MRAGLTTVGLVRYAGWVGALVIAVGLGAAIVSTPAQAVASVGSDSSADSATSPSSGDTGPFGSAPPSDVSDSSDFGAGDSDVAVSTGNAREVVARGSENVAHDEAAEAQVDQIAEEADQPLVRQSRETPTDVFGDAGTADRSRTAGGHGPEADARIAVVDNAEPANEPEGDSAVPLDMRRPGTADGTLDGTAAMATDAGDEAAGASSVQRQPLVPPAVATARTGSRAMSAPDWIRIWISDGTADHPDAGLLLGNGFSYDATSCSSSCDGGRGGIFGNGGSGYGGGTGGDAGWFGHGGDGGDGQPGQSGGAGGKGGLLWGNGGRGGSGGNSAIVGGPGGAGGHGGNVGVLSWLSLGGRGGDGGTGAAGGDGTVIGVGGVGGLGGRSALIGFRAPSGKPGSSGAIPAINPDGWTTTVYQGLSEAIAGSAGQGKTVVFDFDNTTQARDISEAMVALVQKDGLIDPDQLAPDVFPTFTTVDGNPMSITDGVFDYYNALVGSAGDTDRYREFSSLLTTSQLFYGRTVADFLSVAAAAYDNGSAEADLVTGQESLILTAGRPFIYPQMADLYGSLRANGYDVWIVSAGITWGVRWMVQNALNPAIVAKYGDEAALPLDHVVAINTLMKDINTGKLLSDYQLTHQTPDEAYINLDPARMAELEILTTLDGLTSWRGGKVGAIEDIVTTGDLFLVAGDSDGDIEMLNESPIRLTINRMDSPELAETFADELEQFPGTVWLQQPTISSAPVGFLETKCQMADKTMGNPDLAASTAKSLATLESTGRLGSFSVC